MKKKLKINNRVKKATSFESLFSSDSILSASCISHEVSQPVCKPNHITEF